MFHGYDSYVFPHERGHVSAVIIRPTADAGLGVLRHVTPSTPPAGRSPVWPTWTDPRVATPTSGVMIGGGLLNLYRRQFGRPGLVAVGDAVATTAPTAGRGLAMASMQIEALLDLLDAGADPATIAEPFGTWCDTWIRPWVEDHLAFDAEAVRRWNGDDLDLTRPLTSAAIVAAAPADPRIEPYVAEFMAMTALPASLAPAEPLARAVYETGWRQPTAEGPTRDELVALAEQRVSSSTKMAQLPMTNGRALRREVGQEARLRQAPSGRGGWCRPAGNQPGRAVTRATVTADGVDYRGKPGVRSPGASASGRWAMGGGSGLPGGFDERSEVSAGGMQRGSVSQGSAEYERALDGRDEERRQFVGDLWLDGTVALADG